MNRILCVGGTQKDIFIAEKTDCSRIGNYDADGLRFFVNKLFILRGDSAA